MKKTAFFIVVRNPDGSSQREEKQGFSETLRKAGSDQTVTVCYDKRGDTWTATEESTGMAIFFDAPTRKAAHDKAVSMFDRIVSALPKSRAFVAAKIDG